ncbi:hypothetical protein RIE95_09735 [Acidithiobacillus thiooxidans]|uniref:hypothetical protein n=1 Tax=Acidithiobacillus TaxID=119977 RepID=UPI001C079087|nr:MULTISPECIES: hypothetical protein [Acidithiobacillus]MBU2740692.1 hypothetical protein [Acidithiobacillus albertensis]MBU2811224.1 hypothetical protein [Acidithiobacillus thiooxidans]MBU2836685.1 hypothetical protein [Acidithiobacillus thiooxidans]MDR7927259.1 hypothetical protein [Acidithiobacillus thiooxidans]
MKSFERALPENEEYGREYIDPDKESRHLDQKQARDFREKAISVLYKILIGELSFLALLLLMQGFHFCLFHLHASIFDVLAAGIIMQTFGLMIIVFKYLFGGTPYKT